MRLLNLRLVKKIQAREILFGFLFTLAASCTSLSIEDTVSKKPDEAPYLVSENNQNNSEESKKNIEEISYNEERRNEMEVILSSTLGSVFYTITVFVAGALIGNPLWNWASKKFPWNK